MVLLICVGLSINESFLVFSWMCSMSYIREVTDSKGLSTDLFLGCSDCCFAWGNATVKHICLQGFAQTEAAGMK